MLVGGDPVGAAFRSDVAPAFGLDPLSGFFLVVLAITALPALAFARPYLSGGSAPRAVGSLTTAFLLALAGLLAARDVTTFLAFWELMTLVPAAAILAARRDAPVRSAVFAYLAITHLGGAGVWIALLTLAEHGAIGDPAALADAGGGAQTLVAAAALVRFGTRAHRRTRRPPSRRHSHPGLPTVAADHRRGAAGRAGRALTDTPTRSGTRAETPARRDTRSASGVSGNQTSEDVRLQPRRVRSALSAAAAAAASRHEQAPSPTPEAVARDDTQERRCRPLLLTKPAVSGGRLDRRPAAPSDESRQRGAEPSDNHPRCSLEAHEALRRAGQSVVLVAKHNSAPKALESSWQAKATLGWANVRTFDRLMRLSGWAARVAAELQMSRDGGSARRAATSPMLAQLLRFVTQRRELPERRAQSGVPVIPPD